MRRSRHLLALLDTLAPADAREARDLAATRALVAAAPDPFSRTQVAPGHVTASAFVLAPDAAELLLVWHPQLARWLQPGGHVDPGDQDIHRAALREVHEETGLVDLAPAYAGIFDLDIHPIPARRDEAAHQHFDVRFLLRARTREVKLTQEIRAAKWVALEVVAGLESDPSVARAAAKVMRRA